MQQGVSRLTVFFEGPFWVGVYERVEDGRLAVCKITFGAEPKDGEVYALLLESWRQLAFGPGVPAGERPPAKLNPKRMHRAVQKQMARPGPGTKAQQAIKQQQAEGKAARKKQSRLEREQAQARQFALKQEKRKQKHRGH